MKRMIYQVCVGKPSKLYAACIESAKQYCEAHGIDHIVQTQPILRIQPDPFATNRSKEATARLGYLPIYEKENAFGYFDRYDQIAIIDADIYIKPGSPNIFNAIAPEADFGGVLECDMPITEKYRSKIQQYSTMQYHPLVDTIPITYHPMFGYEFYNMGMMVMNKSITKYLNGQTPKQFLQRAEFKDFVDGLGTWKWSTDQTLLNYWVRKYDMDRDNMDWRWNALYKGVKDEAIDLSYFIHFFLKDLLPGKGEDIDLLLNNISDIPSHR